MAGSVYLAEAARSVLPRPSRLIFFPYRPQLITCIYVSVRYGTSELIGRKKKLKKSLESQNTTLGYPPSPTLTTLKYPRNYSKTLTTLDQYE